MSDNIHYLQEPNGYIVPNKDNLEVLFTPDEDLIADDVARLCATASEVLTDVVILGSTGDGTVKMLTTQDDVADILFYLEVAKKSILENNTISDD
tara:strand:- start:1186 stop:1470 length:285 start_codon:yes stop_codon:yes gene_type:complete